jgi:hypothetical protein
VGMIMGEDVCSATQAREVRVEYLFTGDVVPTKAPAVRGEIEISTSN